MADMASILAAMLDEADTLERNGASFSVGRVREFVQEIQTAGPEFITWLSEDEAMGRADWKRATLMAKFAGWQARGYARMNPRNHKERQYLAVIVPLQETIDDVRAQAKRAAQAAIAGAHEGKRA